MTRRWVRRLAICRCGRLFRPDPERAMPSRRYCSRECYYARLKVPLGVVYRRDRGRCHLCGGRVRLHEASRDHLVPRSRGGATTFANISLAHRRCNSVRGDRELRRPALARRLRTVPAATVA